MSAGRDLVHHVGGRVAQHALGADIEDLNDALRVGGDAGEVGAVENRVLQGPRFEQSLFAFGPRWRHPPCPQRRSGWQSHNVALTCSNLRPACHPGLPLSKPV